MFTDCIAVNQQISTEIFSSVETLDVTSWETINNDRNVYLTLPYLKGLEQGLPLMDFRYIVFYNESKEPVGLGYCQIVKITKNEINTDALTQRMGGMLPKNLLNSLDLRVLICGNAFASGENGYLFITDFDQSEGFKLLGAAIDEINYSEKKSQRKISISLIKEFWPQTFNTSKLLKESGCSEVNIDVNMVLKLDPNWKLFDDYLAEMNSKFRTKAKRVFKLSKDVVEVDFTQKIIEERLKDIDDLYNFIVDKANFSFGRLNAKTLLNMKKAFGEDFLFKGYYVEDKLIAFSTATAFDNVLDGNFIGLDYDYNQDYGVYQRILYDFVKHALKIGATEIRIGRTAEEIKSGVGAHPVEMKFYAKHRNKVTNAILRPFVQKLKPNTFNLRKPFKASFYQ